MSSSGDGDRSRWDSRAAAGQSSHDADRSPVNKTWCLVGARPPNAGPGCRQAWVRMPCKATRERAGGASQPLTELSHGRPTA